MPREASATFESTACVAYFATTSMRFGRQLHIKLIDMKKYVTAIKKIIKPGRESQSIDFVLSFQRNQVVMNELFEACETALND